MCYSRHGSREPSEDACRLLRGINYVLRGSEPCAAPNVTPCQHVLYALRVIRIVRCSFARRLSRACLGFVCCSDLDLGKTLCGQTALAESAQEVFENSEFLKC